MVHLYSCQRSDPDLAEALPVLIEKAEKHIKGSSHTFEGVEVTAYRIPAPRPETLPVLTLADNPGLNCVREVEWP
jgi:hypothetical protein